MRRLIIAVATVGSLLPGLSRQAAAQGIWTATSTVNAPSGRELHSAVWTGSKMIVWGGLDGLGCQSAPGGIYDPATDTWATISTLNAPARGGGQAVVWTGSKMIVWGGDDCTVGTYTSAGGVYDPATDSWTTMSTANAPTPRWMPNAVWTGSQMIVWGGSDATTALVNTGGIYDPASDTWTTISTTNAPAPRFMPAAVWTGSMMIVWGGEDGSLGPVNTGGGYDPATDTWTATSMVNVPSAREEHTGVWTGSRLVVWGGIDLNPYSTNTGGIYDPASDSWAATSMTNAPAARYEHTAVWTGAKMIVWSGVSPSGEWVATGGVYDPTTDSWTATSTINAPPGRSFHTAVWTGSKMIVWGGENPNFGSGFLDTGGLYDPVGATRFFTVTPCRVADTRSADGPSGGPALGANTTRGFLVAGVCGVPSSASAVAINVTVVNETAVGDLRIYPAGTAAPSSSTINFTPGKTRANGAVVPLGVSGQLAVQCDMAPGSAHRTDFLFDVTGYFE